MVFFHIREKRKQDKLCSTNLSLHLEVSNSDQRHLLSLKAFFPLTKTYLQHIRLCLHLQKPGPTLNRVKSMSLSWRLSIIQWYHENNSESKIQYDNVSIWHHTLNAYQFLGTMMIRRTHLHQDGALDAVVWPHKPVQHAKHGIVYHIVPSQRIMSPYWQSSSNAVLNVTCMIRWWGSIQM